MLIDVYGPPPHMPELASLIARALTGEPEAVVPDVIAFRRRFSGLHYML